MALSSILEIVTRTCDELGLARPGTSGAVGSSLPQDRQMVALLNAAGVDLVQAHNWSSLEATATITLATASASYALPTDFHRVIPNSGWDRTNYFPLRGSIAPQQHQFWLSSSIVAPTTRKEFRLFLTNSGGTVYVHPSPTAVESLSFLYITKNWATDSAGNNAADTIASDSDLTKFKPELMVKELKWRFRAAKGLDATGLKMECDALRDQLISRDVASGGIDMAGPCAMDPIDILIADGNWSLT